MPRPPTYEAEVAPGLADIAQTEIQQQLGAACDVQPTAMESASVRFTYTGETAILHSLKTVIAVYRVLHFGIPRPKALLGHQHFHRLLDHITPISTAQPTQFHTITLGAAGSESSVMQRLRSELAQALHLQPTSDHADLLLRLRPARRSKKTTDNPSGWEVLIRLTPRPLATRAWRIHNMPGALNASVAHAMLYLLQPTPDVPLLNIACGSGTFLLEHQAHTPGAHSIGIDHDPAALTGATINIAAGNSQQPITLLQADAAQLPIQTRSIQALCADLPFGQLVGSHIENEWFYPVLLHEAARVARIGARFVLITHEVELMKQTLLVQDAWQVVHQRMITLTGLHPRIFVLQRR